MFPCIANLEEEPCEVTSFKALYYADNLRSVFEQPILEDKVISMKEDIPSNLKSIFEKPKPAWTCHGDNKIGMKDMLNNRKLAEAKDSLTLYNKYMETEGHRQVTKTELPLTKTVGGVIKKYTVYEVKDTIDGSGKRGEPIDVMVTTKEGEPADVTVVKKEGESICIPVAKKGELANMPVTNNREEPADMPVADKGEAIDMPVSDKRESIDMPGLIIPDDSISSTTSDVTAPGTNFSGSLSGSNVTLSTCGIGSPGRNTPETGSNESLVIIRGTSGRSSKGSFASTRNTPERRSRRSFMVTSYEKLPESGNATNGGGSVQTRNISKAASAICIGNSVFGSF